MKKAVCAKCGKELEIGDLFVNPTRNLGLTFVHPECNDDKTLKLKKLNQAHLNVINGTIQSGVAQ